MDTDSEQFAGLEQKADSYAYPRRKSGYGWLGMTG